MKMLLIDTVKQADCFVFLGSSVTVQKAGYKVFLERKIKRLIKPSHPDFVLAGIGGVGIDTASLLLNSNFYTFPKASQGICFVEYSVNDYYANTSQALDEVQFHIEAVVTFLLKRNFLPVFLHMYRSIGMTAAVERYNVIAAKWGVPTVNVWEHFDALIKSRKYGINQLLSDSVHTTPRGSALAAAFIFRSLLKAQYEKGIVASDFKRPVFSLSQPRGLGVTRKKEIFSNNLLRSPCWRYGPDDIVSLKVRGVPHMLMLVVGPRSGFLEIRCGKETYKVNTHDFYCYRDRVQALRLPFKKFVKANVQIRVLKDNFDIQPCQDHAREKGFDLKPYVKKNLDTLDRTVRGELPFQLRLIGIVVQEA